MLLILVMKKYELLRDLIEMKWCQTGNRMNGIRKKIGLVFNGFYAVFWKA